MKKKLFLVICICILLLTSCLVQSEKYWDSQKKIVEKCRNMWVYKDWEQEKEGVVLLFSKKFNTGVSSYPNFLIAVTKENDTIAFLDKDFDEKVKVGVKIKLLPLQWNEAEKAIKKPVFTVQKKAKDNKLYCAIKEVYYGKIELIKIR